MCYYLVLKISIFRQRAAIAAVITFFSLVGTVSVVGNFIVLFVVYKSKQLRHSQYVYNCCIAISDIVWGFTICYLYILSYVKVLGLELIKVAEMCSFSGKPDVSIDENNITTLKYKLDNLKMHIYHRIYLRLILQLITPVTLLVSFITLFFASMD